MRMTGKVPSFDSTHVCCVQVSSLRYTVRDFALETQGQQDTLWTTGTSTN